MKLHSLKLHSSHNITGSCKKLALHSSLEIKKKNHLYFKTVTQFSYSLVFHVALKITMEQKYTTFFLKKKNLQLELT